MRQLKKWKSFKKVAVIMVMVMLAEWIPSVLPTYAAKGKTTQQEIDLAKKDKDKLENQLDKTEEELEGLQNEKKSLTKELNKLNEQLTEVSEHLEDLERQIKDKIQDIADTQAALDEAKAVEKWQQECMVIRVREMYERNDTSYINALLSVGNFSDMLNMADRFEKIADYDKQKLAEFKENRILIEETEARLQTEKIELDNLQVEAEAEKNKVAGLISQTSKTIDQYADDIKEAEKKAEEYEAQIKKKEEDLEYLKKKLEEEKRLSLEALKSTWRDISEIQFAEGDRYLLANLIYCEAGGEPYEGQVAVGAVVMNRVMSSRYPDTVVGVIYQKSQFSPAGSGRLELALAQNKATKSCYKAADEAMAGVTNVGNCLYFRTPIPGLTGLNIGGHVFY